MGNEKGKNIVIMLLVAIVAILSTILVLVLTGNLDLNNEGSNPTLDNNENAEQDDTEENFEYANWMNYLLESDIQEIRVTRVRNVLFGDNIDYGKTVTLTKNDLEKIFRELNGYSMIKQYVDGLGGPAKDVFELTYFVDGISYKFRIIYGVIVVGDLDSKLLEILNNNNYPIRDENYKDIYGSSYIFRFDTTESIYSIFDECFEVK